MPDDVGKLSEVDVSAVIAWLDEHWTGQRLCPISGETNWQINEHVVHALPFSTTATLIAAGFAYPQITVSCEDCGYTIFFSAVRLGLYPSAPAAPKSFPEGGGHADI